MTVGLWKLSSLDGRWSPMISAPGFVGSGLGLTGPVSVYFEMASLIFSFCLSVEASTVAHTGPSLRYTLPVAGMLSNLEITTQFIRLSPSCPTQLHVCFV